MCGGSMKSACGGNPRRSLRQVFLNMDGVHLDGWCHHGKISNLRGTCFDDMVALNANDGQCAQEEGDITDIDIDFTGRWTQTGRPE